MEYDSFLSYLFQNRCQNQNDKEYFKSAWNNSDIPYTKIDKQKFNSFFNSVKTNQYQNSTLFIIGSPSFTDFISAEIITSTLSPHFSRILTNLSTYDGELSTVENTFKRFANPCFFILSSHEKDIQFLKENRYLYWTIWSFFDSSMSVTSYLLQIVTLFSLFYKQQYSYFYQYIEFIFLSIFLEKKPLIDLNRLFVRSFAPKFCKPQHYIIRSFLYCLLKVMKTPFLSTTLESTGNMIFLAFLWQENHINVFEPYTSGVLENISKEKTIATQIYHSCLQFYKCELHLSSKFQALNKNLLNGINTANCSIKELQTKENTWFVGCEYAHYISVKTNMLAGVYFLDKASLLCFLIKIPFAESEHYSVFLQTIKNEFSCTISYWSGFCCIRIPEAKKYTFLQQFENDFSYQTFYKKCQPIEISSFSDIFLIKDKIHSAFAPFGYGNSELQYRCKDAIVKSFQLINETNKREMILSDNGKQVYHFLIPRNIQAPTLYAGEHIELTFLIRKINHQYYNLVTTYKSIYTSKFKADTLFETQPSNTALSSFASMSQMQLKKYEKNGFYTIMDVLNNYPTTYEDNTTKSTVRSNEIGTKGCIVGTIKNLKVIPPKNTKLYVTIANCLDIEQKPFTATWFTTSPYLSEKHFIYPGYYGAFAGKITKNEFAKCTNVSVKNYDRNVYTLLKVLPNYKTLKGISIKTYLKLVKKCYDSLDNTDYFEKSIVERYNLVVLKDKYKIYHCPTNLNEIKAAQYRDVFECLFKFALSLSERNIDEVKNYPSNFQKDSIAQQIITRLPYKLTSDQLKTFNEIIQKLKCQQYVNTLIQGDVGCGKTIVALLILAFVAENGFQGCMVAPTDVLAQQHYTEAKALLEPYGITVALLVGGIPTNKKSKIQASIANGETQIVIGTHAVFSKKTTFCNLGLAIIDEQHKFGVSQRKALTNITPTPHIINMSATPIPRSLSMAIYGSQVTIDTIRSMPNGRIPVKTELIKKNVDGFKKIKEQLDLGYQAYVICPAISGNKMTNVQDTYQTISEYFNQTRPQTKICILNGKMSKNEISNNMSEFCDKKIDILISTTVIEVGVNNPNATIMLIENADRFGLSQLHQLRGRVGRGEIQSYCLLQTETDNPNSLNRLKVLCTTHDGFKIALEDFKARGSGNLFGKEQSGQNKDILLAMQYPELYKQISQTISEIIKDPIRKKKYQFLLDTDEKNENSLFLDE